MRGLSNFVACPPVLYHRPTRSGLDKLSSRSFAVSESFAESEFLVSRVCPLLFAEFGL